MNKQQTAVEWLIDNLKGQLNIDEVTYIIKRSKEMEKKQIENAYQSGQDNIDYTASYVDENGLENYYNETYGGNK